MPSSPIGNIKTSIQNGGTLAEVEITINQKVYHVTLSYTSQVARGKINDDLQHSLQKIDALVQMFHLGERRPGKKYTKEITINGNNIIQKFAKDNQPDTTRTIDILTDLPQKLASLQQKISGNGHAGAKKTSWEDKASLLSKVITAFQTEHPHSMPEPSETIRPQPTPAPAPSMRKWVDQPSIVTTKAKHTENGKYTPERLGLHETIKQQLTDKRAPTEKPMAVIVLGGPGAKWGIKVKQIIETLPDQKDKVNQFVPLVHDYIAAQLPEYQQAVNRGKENGQIVTDRSAASMCQEEINDIIVQTGTQLAEQKFSLLIDNPGYDLDTYNAIITALKSKGYDVRVVMADQPQTTWDETARQYSNGTGHYISNPDLSWREARTLFYKLAPLATTAHLFRTDSQNPEAIYTQIGRKKTIIKSDYLENQGWNRLLRIVSTETDA